MTPLGKFVRSVVLPRLGLTAKAAAEWIGEDPSFFSKCLNGGSRVPPESIEAWADALRLDGDTRRRFVDLAALTQIRKVSIQRRIAAAMDKSVELQTQIDAAKKLQIEITAFCDRIKPDLRRVAEPSQDFDTP